MSGSQDLGQMATLPRQISWRGWFAILKRVVGQIAKDHVMLISAGVAFYGLLALFPGITAVMAVAGLILEPSQVTDQIDTLTAFVPQAAADIIIGQASAVAGSQNGGLGVAAVVGFALALWSASAGVGSLIEGINVAYDETEKRGMIRLYVTRLALTLVLIVGMIGGLAATIVLPSILQLLALGPTTEFLIGIFRWITLTVLTVLGISLLYRFAPCRQPARLRWLIPGALIATILWIAASASFALYVKNFGSYQETFGALAGVVILLMWLWISAVLILTGAEINAEAEAQTRIDTTTGAPMPMGARGAVKADKLAGQ